MLQSQVSVAVLKEEKDTSIYKTFSGSSVYII